MADSKISNLPITNTITGSEYLIVDDGILTSRTTINSLSARLPTANVVVSGGNITVIDSIDSNYNLSINDYGKQFTYTSTNSVTAFITNEINADNYSVTFTQLDYGTIYIKLDPSYNTGSIISVNNVDHTLTKGASINIKRIANNQFLVTPVFFSLVQ